MDARWAHHAGATTFTRLLLEGLGDLRPPGRWIVWGPDDMGRRCWPGAVHVPTSVDPVAWFGQRSVLRVPKADRALHPHQTRPAHRIPAASCVLDLIQLQEPSPFLRLAKTLRLRASVRAAAALFTISSAVRDRLVSDFGAEPGRLTVLALPVDRAAAARVAAARRATPPGGGYIVAVGRFDRHKNFPRLVEAFSQTRYAAGGGGLTLVGGTVEQLRGLGVDRLPAGVQVLGRVGAAELEQVLTGATALVQASLDEGYGLPVAEALAGEVPVVSSPVPAVVEFGPPGVPTFDPRSVTEMRDAIDETVVLAETGAYWDRVARGPWLDALPTARRLAEQVLGGLDRIGQ